MAPSAGQLRVGQAFVEMGIDKAYLEASIAESEGRLKKMAAEIGKTAGGAAGKGGLTGFLGGGLVEGGAGVFLGVRGLGHVLDAIAVGARALRGDWKGLSDAFYHLPLAESADRAVRAIAGLETREQQAAAATAELQQALDALKGSMTLGAVTAGLNLNTVLLGLDPRGKALAQIDALVAKKSMEIQTTVLLPGREGETKEALDALVAWRERAIADVEDRALGIDAEHVNARAMAWREKIGALQQQLAAMTQTPGEAAHDAAILGGATVEQADAFAELTEQIEKATKAEKEFLDLIGLEGEIVNRGYKELIDANETAGKEIGDQLRAAGNLTDLWHREHDTNAGFQAVTELQRQVMIAGASTTRDPTIEELKELNDRERAKAERDERYQRTVVAALGQIGKPQ
jgi:hypothetical protein